VPETEPHATGTRHQNDKHFYMKHYAISQFTRIVMVYCSWRYQDKYLPFYVDALEEMNDLQISSIDFLIVS